MAGEQTKHDLQKTNSSSSDGRLPLRPAIHVSVNPFSLCRSRAVIVPRSCLCDSSGTLPAGYTEVTVTLMLICASENCWTGPAPGCLLLSVLSGCWNFRVPIRPVATPVVKW